MNELMCERTTDAIETLRFKSRFDDFSEDLYYKGEPYRFQSDLLSTDSANPIDITCESRHHGIRKPAAISVELYRTWIYQGSCITLQRIGVLCHAFLYAVDLDQHNARILEFAVPFFTQGVGYTPVKVQAELIGGMNKRIFFDLA